MVSFDGRPQKSGPHSSKIFVFHRTSSFIFSFLEFLVSFCDSFSWLVMVCLFSFEAFSAYFRGFRGWLVFTLNLSTKTTPLGQGKASPEDFLFPFFSLPSFCPSSKVLLPTPAPHPKYLSLNPFLSFPFRRRSFFLRLFFHSPLMRRCRPKRLLFGYFESCHLHPGFKFSLRVFFFLMPHFPPKF